jgi:predicted nucleic acid-binding protein
MVYALDTNIVIHYLRNQSNVLQNFRDAISQNHSVVIPLIVDYELRRGFRISPTPKKEAAYEILTEYCGIETDFSFWGQAIDIYAKLYQKGFTVGEIDILLAALCIKHGYILVTNNTKDFENIDGLQLIDWA